MKPRPFKLPNVVRFTSKISLRVQRDRYDCPLQLGQISHDEKAISLRVGLKGRKLEKTFWHEVVHAFCLIHKIKLGKTEKEQIRMEEKIAKMIEGYVASFFRLNNLRFR